MSKYIPKIRELAEELAQCVEDFDYELYKKSCYQAQCESENKARILEDENCDLIVENMKFREENKKLWARLVMSETPLEFKDFIKDMEMTKKNNKSEWDLLK